MDLKLIKICLHNSSHVKNSEVCLKCVELLKQNKTTFNTMNIPVEFRPLLFSITEFFPNTDLDKCWELHAGVKKQIHGYKLENLLYAFYKGDIGNSVLKRICNNLNCFNPYHMRSRFEPTQISKKVRVGFNKKYHSLDELTDAQWLKH